MVSGGSAADRPVLADVPAWFCFFKPRFCFVFLFVFAGAVLRGQRVGSRSWYFNSVAASFCFFGRILAGLFPLFRVCGYFVYTAADCRSPCGKRSSLAKRLHNLCQRSLSGRDGNHHLRRLEYAASHFAGSRTRYREKTAAAGENRTGDRYPFRFSFRPAVCGRTDRTDQPAECGCSFVWRRSGGQQPGLRAAGKKL